MEYAVVFTSNATAAIKIVAETFDFGSPDAGSFYYCQENHTSILGMREVVKTPNKFVLTKPELLENLEREKHTTRTASSDGNSLLVFSAQCNFSGYKMPLDLIEIVQKNGLINQGKQISGVKAMIEKDCSNFFILLDAASFVASNYLDLDKYKPDFICVSFYKMFGYVFYSNFIYIERSINTKLRF